MIISNTLDSLVKHGVMLRMSDATLTTPVDQVGHEMSVGNVIRFDCRNYVNAQADSVNNDESAISFVVSVTDCR